MGGLTVSENLQKKEIANILGRPLRTIQYWTDIGLVVPDVIPSQGKGIARVYSPRNLLEFAMIDIMVANMQVPLETIKYVFRCLRNGIDLDELQMREVFGDSRPPPKFYDFYVNSEWGKTKELIYSDSILYDQEKHEIQKPLRYLYVLDANSGGGFILEHDVSNPFLPFGHLPVSTKILWLGTIKEMAEAKIDRYFVGAEQAILDGYTG